VDTGDVLTKVLTEHPDVAAHLEELRGAAWRAVDPVLLELCRLRISQLLGCEAEQGVRTSEAVAGGLDEAAVSDLRAWPASRRFGPRERACLAFCEQFMIDVAGLTDDVAGAVADQLGPKGFVNLVNALLVVEQRQRLRLAWERLVLPPEPAV
jgi:alkylhydroperoxidase family enzyme